jgi:hypothetical protein
VKRSPTTSRAEGPPRSTRCTSGARRSDGLASVRDAVARCQNRVGSRGAGVLGRRLRGWRLGQRVLRTRRLHFDLGRSRITGGCLGHQRDVGQCGCSSGHRRRGPGWVGRTVVGRVPGRGRGGLDGRSRVPTIVSCWATRMWRRRFDRDRLGGRRTRGECRRVPVVHLGGDADLDNPRLAPKFRPAAVVGLGEPSLCGRVGGIGRSIRRRPLGHVATPLAREQSRLAAPCRMDRHGARGAIIAAQVCLQSRISSRKRVHDENLYVWPGLRY